MARLQGLYCSRCRKVKVWDKLKASYSRHQVRSVTERTWRCRDCGEIVKVETVPNEYTD